MNLEDLNKIIEMYDLIIERCNELLWKINDDSVLIMDPYGSNIKDYLIHKVEDIRDKVINTLKCGD